MIVVIAGDADGINVADTQFTSQQRSRYQTAAAHRDNAFPLFNRKQTLGQFAGMDLKHVPGNDVFFAHRIEIPANRGGVKMCNGEKVARDYKELTH
jgi:hypothetical protein